MFSSLKNRVLMAVAAIAFLAAPAVAQQIQFGGINHEPLGDAKLVVDGETLWVDNIGESGKDGVLVHAGDSQTIVTTVADMDPAEMPEGSSIIGTSRGQVNGNPGTEISQLTINQINGEIVFHCKWLLSMSGAHAVVETDQGAITLPTPGPFRIPGPVRCERLDPVWRSLNGDIMIMVEFDERTPIILPNEELVHGSSISVVIEGVKERIDSVESISYTGTNVGHFGINAQEVVLNDLHHKSIGNATLDTDGGNLIVKNLGEMGGFTTDLDSDFYGVDLAPLSLNTHGSSLLMESTGTVDGKPGIDLGYAGLNNVNGSLNLMANYSSIGQSGVLVQLLRGGKLVGETIVEAGNVGLIKNPGRITGCGKWEPWFPPNPPCFYVRFEDFQDVIVGGVRYQADSVRMLTPEVSGTLEVLNSFNLRAQGVEQLIVTGEQTQAQAPQPNFKN